jgi:lactate dehydrogenase-like 2-hydroxyacid dehydrogenase
VNTEDLIDAQNGHIGAVGLDVYERKNIFFSNHITKKMGIIYTLYFAPSLMCTQHQGFFDQRSIRGIAHHHC